MRTEEKRHKNMPGAKKDGKSKTSNSAPRDLSTAEPHRPVDVDTDTTTGISFLINYRLVARELQGTITHERAHIKEEFAGRGETTIIQFMKRYLSKLEKSVMKLTDEEAQQPGEVRITQHSELHNPGLEVVPEDSAQPSDILKQGQPFQLRWTLEPPSPSGISGERLHYRVVVCGKNLERGEHIQIGEGGGEINFSSSLTALIRSEPLPPGKYIVEADAGFSLKSIQSDRQSVRSARRLIQVA